MAKPWVWSNVQYGQGPNNSVKIVQAALNKATGSHLGVDGVFGNATKAAYTAWQKQLGLSGSGADGKVGSYSLRELAKRGGFDIRTGTAAPAVPPKPAPKPAAKAKAWIYYDNAQFGKGPNNSVKIVQEVLNKQVGAGLKTDGVYGNATKAAYAKWQRKLGYSGAGADGLPGRASMGKLATAGVFDVVWPKAPPKPTVGNYEMMPEPSQDMTHVYWGGRIVNRRTAVLLDRAVALFGRSFTLTQGSYNRGVAASAGTHDGGGVVDINVSPFSSSQRAALVQALRKAGFAAWLRTPSEGFSYHIHANAIGDKQMAGLARSQVQSYFAGRSGLVSNARLSGALHWPNWADRYH